LFNLTTSSNEIGNIVNFLKFCKLNLNFISVIAKDKERLSKVKKKKKKKKKKSTNFSLWASTWLKSTKDGRQGQWHQWLVLRPLQKAIYAKMLTKPCEG
jgi:hypothetical protein